MSSSLRSVHRVVTHTIGFSPPPFSSFSAHLSRNRSFRLLQAPSSSRSVSYSFVRSVSVPSCAFFPYQKNQPRFFCPFFCLRCLTSDARLLLVSSFLFLHLTSHTPLLSNSSSSSSSDPAENLTKGRDGFPSWITIFPSSTFLVYFPPLPRVVSWLPLTPSPSFAPSFTSCVCLGVSRQTSTSLSYE